MIRITEAQFEDLKRRQNPEVFTEAQISKWITDYSDMITKSTTDELDEQEKKTMNEFDHEFKSFTRIQVISAPKEGDLEKGLRYNDFYIREQQVIWDEPIIKSLDGKEVEERATTGTFADTAHNRKLERVGQRFGDPVSVEGEGLGGVIKSSEDELEKAEGDRGGKIIGHSKSGKPIYATKYTSGDKLVINDPNHKWHGKTVHVQKVNQATDGGLLKQHSYLIGLTRTGEAQAVGEDKLKFGAEK